MELRVSALTTDLTNDQSNCRCLLVVSVSMQHALILPIMSHDILWTLETINYSD